MGKILDGNMLAKRVRNKIKTEIDNNSGQPGLAVLLIGEDPASHTYVRIKKKACDEVGIHFKKFEYPTNVKTQTLIDEIRYLNNNDDIHGILVQLPLPSQDTNAIISAISPNKDVDGFHQENLRKIRAGKPGIASAAALGIIKLIDEAENELKDKQVIIVASKLFAEPIVILLEERGAKVSVVASNDETLGKKTKTADILIVAAGKPGLINGEMVKPGATVIDVGTTKVEGKLKGDVEYESVEPIAGAITPVPGGVGPMTVAMLITNVLKAKELQKRD